MNTINESEPETNKKIIEEKVEEKFLEELCWQDKDGKWFLDGNTHTVQKILEFIFEVVTQAKEERDREIVRNYWLGGV